MFPITVLNKYIYKFMIGDVLSVRPEHVELVTSQLRKKLAVSSAGSLLLVEFTTLTDYLHYLQAVSQALAMCGHVAMMLLAAAVSDFYVPTSDLVSAESFMTLFVSTMCKCCFILLSVVL